MNVKDMLEEFNRESCVDIFEEDRGLKHWQMHKSGMENKTLKEYGKEYADWLHEKSSKTYYGLIAENYKIYDYIDNNYLRFRRYWIKRQQEKGIKVYG